jgi:hypothetical protein
MNNSTDEPMGEEKETLKEAVARVFRVCEINESKVADTVAQLENGDIGLKALIGGKTRRESLERLGFSPGICDALLSLYGTPIPAPAPVVRDGKLEALVRSLPNVQDPPEAIPVGMKKLPEDIWVAATGS